MSDDVRRPDLLAEEAADVLAALAAACSEESRFFPGEPSARQPVHTVYGGAHLFRADTAARLGELARRALERHAPDPAALAGALGMPVELAERIYPRVRRKLETEPVEDFRIDFEDGYGVRPDREEDAAALAAARETARAVRERSAPPFIGIRIKPFTEATARAVRTLDLYVSELVEQAGGLPEQFVVTLPKVSHPAQVETLVQLFELLEHRLGLRSRSLRLEPMIELTEALFDRAGRFRLPLLLAAAQGRMRSAAFGTYDYTASCDITAAFQAMRHPVCDLAKGFMRIAFGRTGVTLSDGATNIMPVEVHRGEALDPAQEASNRRAVHAAWRLAYEDIHHSLANGFYQGWDLHPAQLPVRFTACYGFFHASLDQAAERLRNFVDKAAQATLVGDVFDDAATGQGLLNFFIRAVGCGAITGEELGATGLTMDELRMRSFARILAARARRAADS
jgi:citrate lyase beta subunit